MGLNFEPDRVVYDPEEGLLRMFARDGYVLVKCAVSKAALVALEDDALAGPHAMILTYRRNKERVHAIAQRKYRQRRFEARKAVVIRLEDLGQDPAWRSVAERATRVPYLGRSYQVVPQPGGTVGNGARNLSGAGGKA
jgi:hypothetical protein